MPFYNSNRTTNPSTHLRGKRNNYKTFIEDPDKAVFLSGFRNNVPVEHWKDYREAVYQDLNKTYNVYIKKLDLPVNSKYGYLHCGTCQQAEKLLNLRNDYDDDSGKTLSAVTLAGGKIHVYEYKKTEKRLMDETCRKSPSRYVREQNTRRYSPNNQLRSGVDRSRSRSPFAKQTHDSAFQLSEQSSDDEQLSDIQKINFHSTDNTESTTLQILSTDDNQSPISSPLSNDDSSNKTADQIFTEASDILIYQHLCQCWKVEFNILDDQTQQTLMYMFIQACHTQGMDAAKNVLEMVSAGAQQQLISI